MSRVEHLAWESLVDIAEGRALNASAHLSQCEDCARAFREAQVLVGSLYLAGAPEPSRGLMARTWARLVAENVRGQVGAATDRVRDLAREVWATLTADSLRPTLAVRGQSTATPRLLVYETDEFSVSLSITPGRSGFDLIGNVVPKRDPDLPAGGRVTLVGATGFSTEISEFGEFRLSGAPAQGATTLSVEFPEQRIHIGPIPPLATE